MNHCVLWPETDARPHPAAPDAWVAPVPADLAREVAKRCHYMHRRPQVAFAYGLHRGTELVGIVTFGPPASRHVQLGACPADPDAVIELNRLWLDDDLPGGIASWFLARARRLLPAFIVVSYADTAAGHTGFVYRAAGFRYAGWTDMERAKPRLDYIPADPNIHPRDAYRHGWARKARRRLKIKYWTVSGPPLARRFLARACGWPSLSWQEMPPPAVHRQHRIR